MFYNPRSLLKLVFATAFFLEASAGDLDPWGDGHHPKIGGSGQRARRAPIPMNLDPLRPGDLPHRGKAKRYAHPPVELKAISDPGVLLRGRSEKREMPGKDCFDPAKHSTFFWGGYAGDNIYIANFTMSAHTDDEFILPIENFAKQMKSLKCGTPGQPIILEFSDVESLSYAKSAWKWIDDADVNHFTLVTEPDMCYKGDNRSPYLVSAIKFNDATLTAEITAEEKPWSEIAKNFKLSLGHEYVDPATANVTHPHLMSRGEGGNTMDIAHTFNGNLFNYAKDSPETAGMAMKADLEVTTGGNIIADFDIERGGFFNAPNGAKLSIHPQGVNAIMKLSLDVDGKLGKDFQWAMTPEIEIPIQALNIKNILEVGPFVTLGIHFGSTALEGTGKMSVGTKAKVKDDAKFDVSFTKPEDNSISGWSPDFEKIDPTFDSSIPGNIRAWTELGIQMKVEVLSMWGYQASLDAQLPYFEAKMSGVADDKGVCDSKKTAGVNLNTDVGINVNLNAGKVNEAPSFEKKLFETGWPLYSTCVPVGPDKPTETPTPTPTETSAEPTSEPPIETPITSPGMIGTGTGNMPMVTGAHSLVGTGTGYMPMMTGAVGTGTASSGWPMQTGNTTFLRLRMAQRRPTQLYF